MRASVEEQMINHETELQECKRQRKILISPASDETIVLFSSDEAITSIRSVESRLMYVRCVRPLKED